MIGKREVRRSGKTESHEVLQFHLSQLLYGSFEQGILKRKSRKNRIG